MSTGKQRVIYNNFKEEDKPTFERLKKGAVARFELLGLRKDPKNPKILKCPQSVYLPMKEYITTKSGEVVAIAPTFGLDANGDPDIIPITFRANTRGSIVLYGDNPRHTVMYNYMKMSSYNQDNPDRDKTITPIFREIVAGKLEKVKVNERKERLKAENHAANLEEAEVRKFFMSRGESGKGDIMVLRDRIEEIAGSNPKDYNEQYNTITRKGRLVAGTALSAKIVYVDKRNKLIKLKETKETICSCFGSLTEESLVQDLTSFIESKEGESVKLHLERELVKLGLLTEADLK